ncbi:MAG: Fic family protein [Bacteroidales bacterium]|nr:Fic family protein [Bacteroidales bacterium]MCF8389898.1 Fic family protein [Bacteroidales bacterium]
MALPSEKLAQSLEELKKLQNEQGIAVIRTDQMSRTHRDRLVLNGFLRPVIKGWYITKQPSEMDGDTTFWYTSFWYFASTYLNSRFKSDWSLSPEQSLLLHSGNATVPKQLLVRSPKANNNKIELIHNISFFDVELELPAETERDEIEGLKVYSVPAGLLACGADFFSRNPIDARTCLASMKDSSDILSLLLQGGHSVKAGRIAGAFRNIGRDKIADEIVNTMKAVGFDVRENDPFEEKLLMTLSSRETSPFANRIKLMWHQMREGVLANFPAEIDPPKYVEAYLKEVEELYLSDAYHSLSIEGYRVTEELIEQVRKGDWNPDANETDREQKNALAARGYWQCFQKVKGSIKRVLEGVNPSDVVFIDHGVWYRELFAPSIAVGILKPSDLAGYRNTPVYISGSKHTPPNKEAVRDSIPVLFDLLKEEKSAPVRAILGHFLFVYIHPYVDGNGRLARFLLNVMLASGGFPWTIIPVERRDDYMSALEEASVNQDITKFTMFVAELVEKAIKGRKENN